MSTDNDWLTEGFDSTDREIINILQEDGRTAYRKIGRLLGVSEGTVRARVARLEDSGALTISAIVDLSKLGVNVQAFCLLSAAPGFHERVIEELEAWSEVVYISSCIGEADIYVQFVCSDANSLSNLIHSRLGTIEGVAAYRSFLEVKTHKVSYRYDLS